MNQFLRPIAGKRKNAEDKRHGKVKQEKIKRPADKIEYGFCKTELLVLI